MNCKIVFTVMRFEASGRFLITMLNVYARGTYLIDRSILPIT